MSSVKRNLAIVLLLAAFATGCTDQNDGARIGESFKTPSPEIASSPDTTSADYGVLRIRRQLPEGPIFVEGSAAYARVTDSSETVVFDGYFDVPRVPDASKEFPRRLRLELPLGQYQLTIAQRACDASACSQQGPEGWGDETLRCRVRFRLSAEQIFTATAVVRSEGCRIVQTVTGGQLGD